MKDNRSTQKTKNKSVKQAKSQPSKNENRKTKIWLIVGGIIIGTFMIAGIIIGVLAINGASDDDDDISCPTGEYRLCGTLGDGEKRCGCHSEPTMDFKPIIYLYPEKETDVVVRLGKPEKLTSSYPKYIDGWNVTAYPNGDLIDKTNGNKLYSLYWEGERDYSDFDFSTGFVVRGKDSIAFLEEKLDILGLNYKEKEEFIVYWLPKLEANKFNYIYFATDEEIEAGMPLEFSVQPDTVIRVRMVFKGLNENKEIKEQILEPAPERKGFTVIEWGGIDLNRS